MFETEAYGKDKVTTPLQPHELVDAASEVHRVTTGPQELVSVPVPPGQDGKLWKIRGLTASELWFYDVPPQLATSPGAVMLPRDLALADGLLQTAR